MLGLWLVIGGIGLLAISGLPAWLLPLRSCIGQRVSAVLMVGGSAAGIAGVCLSLNAADAIALRCEGFLPWGQVAVSIDSLSAIYLLPVFVVPALGAIYGLGHWPQAEHPANARQLGLFYGILAGSMAMVVIARMTAILPTSAVWWGGVLLGAGAVSGAAGIAFAITQPPIKSLLASSSVENTGIIAMCGWFPWGVMGAKP